MIIFKQGLKSASGVKSQIMRLRYPLFFNNTEVLSPVFSCKCFNNISISCQGRPIDPGVGIEKCIKHNTLFNADYDQTNKLSINYWNNLKKSDFYTSSANYVYDHMDNQRKEKKEANILIGLTLVLIAVITFAYSKVDFGEYDKPSKAEKL